MYGYTMYRYNMDGRCSPMETLNRTLIFIRSRSLSLSLSFSLSHSLSLSLSVCLSVCLSVSLSLTLIFMVALIKASQLEAALPQY